ncbi:MAG: murein hydrolase activator EnvC [Granulosicoccus sp.]
MPPNMFNLFTAIALLFFATAGSLLANEAKSISDVELQMQETNARLKALDDEIASSRALKADLQKALESTTSNVQERKQRLLDLATDIERYEKKLDSLEAQVADAQESVSARQQSLAESLRQTQVIGQQSALKIVLQNDDPAVADRLNVYTEYFLKAQNQTINQQVSVLKRIKKAKQNTLKDRNWLNYLQKKANQQHQALVTDAGDKQRSLGELETGLSHKTQTVAQLRADQERLQSLMDELKALQSAQSGYFKAGKGSYSPPVAGVLKARFGDVKSVGKLRWSGVFIQARNGIPVRAVADGEVVYSDWLQGFGMLVIIDHGDGYMTLYGGNRDVTVPAGQWVESGATIATVGDSSGQNSSGVYFEIRHKATAVNPEEWISLDSGLKRASN